MDINLVNAEVLTVGPDEVLIVKLPKRTKSAEMSDAIFAAFKEIGVDRVIVFADDVEFAKVPIDSSFPG